MPGVISILETYTLDEARRRLRWTESSMRSARRRGLRLLQCGKRKYVTGREIVRFLENDASSTDDGSSSSDERHRRRTSE
ncbi:MAG: hypothetical protein DWQ35_12080 [Planctomycetota bacterium]|nr:MAG: hypothetical protein DWQ35_12080 [Planctomycetota bacterium]REK30369.1 MAG: hypothetical protein DWQ42_01795 [Planctomycetota bacterium]REK40252.1 MAG: hypothetical protein DWQ46_16840 [Planctomycetota bacterium]